MTDLRDPSANIEFPDAPPIEPTPEFLALCAQAGIEFEPGEVESLGRYLGLLIAGSGVMNLTAITDPAEAWVRHVFDSLTLLPMLAELPDVARIIDVGSGAGTPGIPLAIVCPHLQFTLLDATAKKCVFMRWCVDRLALENTAVAHNRAERAGQDRGLGNIPGMRESFDVVVARAVGRLAGLAELTVPLAAPGGHVLLIKGARAEEELEEAAHALAELRAVPAGIVPTPTGRVVILEKRSRTPRIYPRRDGEPSKKPLLAPGGPGGGPQGGSSGGSSDSSGKAI